MGLFKKRTDTTQMDAIKAEIAAMAARLDQADADKAELGTRVQGLTTRLDTPLSPPPPEAPALKPVLTEAELDMLRARIQRLTDKLDQVDARITTMSGELSEQLAQIDKADKTDKTDQIELIDARITAVATELANQITELSGEVESLAADRPPTDDVVTEIRAAQVQLANEQARYQIAFREDLADLAERLRR